MKQGITLFKFLFTIILIGSYLTSHAQETVCGGDDACNVYYLVITENTSSGCQNGYNITADIIEDGYFSISVEGADFTYNGQTYLAGQWVDVSSSVTQTKYCDEDNQYRDYFVWQGSVNVTNTSQPYSVKVRAYQDDILKKECALVESSGTQCFSANDLCVYKNAGGALQAFVHPLFGQQGGYDYQWQKWNTETETWQTVSSGSSASASIELPIAAEFAYRSDRYRFRLRDNSSTPWLNSSSAYVRYIPQDCSFVVP